MKIEHFEQLLYLTVLCLPEVHVKCVVHELDVDVLHGENVERHLGTLQLHTPPSHILTVPRHLDKHRDAAIVWPNSPVIPNLVHQTIIQICEVVTVVHGKGRVFNCIATWKFFNSVEMSSRSSLDVFRAEVEDRVRRRRRAAAGVMVPSVSMLPCLTLHSP